MFNFKLKTPWEGNDKDYHTTIQQLDQNIIYSKVRTLKMNKSYYPKGNIEARGFHQSKTCRCSTPLRR